MFWQGLELSKGQEQGFGQGPCQGLGPGRQ